MSLVNFFIVGAPKCGTTSLYHFLNAHKEVDFGAMKEPHLFSTDLRLKGNTSQEDYQKNYDGSNPWTRVFGDASVMHLYSRNAAKNIQVYNPDAKILIMVRRPVDFVVSYHHEQIYSQIEDRTSLQQAWNLCEERLTGECIPTACPDRRLLDYKSIAAFDEQIQRYFDHFPATQIRIGFIEDIQHNEKEFIAALYSFLEVTPDDRTRIGHYASAKTYRRAWHRQVVAIAMHPRLQELWKHCKRSLGLTHRFRLIHKFRTLTTISGEKSVIDADLAALIDAHYASNWAKVLTLVGSHNLLHLNTMAFK